jgi:hypothetical protein
MSVRVTGRPVPFVGDAVPLIGDPVTVISGPLARISEAVALVGGMVALVGEAFPLLGSVIGLIQGGPAAGQVGMGGLEGLLGGLGADLGLPHPDIVKGQGGQPLPLGVLDDLPGQLGQLRELARARVRSCWNAVSGSSPWLAASTPLACSIQTRLATPGAAGRPPACGWPAPRWCGSAHRPRPRTHLPSPARGLSRPAAGRCRAPASPPAGRPGGRGRSAPRRHAAGRPPRRSGSWPARLAGPPP